MHPERELPHGQAIETPQQVFYILQGAGILRIGAEQKEFAVGPADVVRIPPATLHSIRCAGKEPLRYLAVDCFVTGRPKDEPTWDAHVRLICRQQGWNYEQVIRT